MEYFTLNNGVKIPAVGFGTYNPAGDDYVEIMKRAIDAGYRLFDSASLYGTEKQVGKALAESGLARNEYMVQSKLWIDEMGYDGVMQAFERTMERMKLDYLDIYFIHWPRAVHAYSEIPGHSELSQNELPYRFGSDWKGLLTETYAALDELYEKKLIRGIGLSNFLPHHIMHVLDICKTKPVVDQLELHLGYTQAAAVNFAAENGIRCEGWAPFARGAILNDGFFKSMADKYGVTVSQLALRFLYQSGIVCLPKAKSAEKMKLNLDIFSFELTDEDYYLLACMVPTYWCNEHPDFRIPKFDSDKTV